MRGDISDIINYSVVLDNIMYSSDTPKLGSEPFRPSLELHWAEWGFLVSFRREERFAGDELCGQADNVSSTV